MPLGVSRCTQPGVFRCPEVAASQHGYCPDGGNLVELVPHRHQKHQKPGLFSRKQHQSDIDRVPAAPAAECWIPAGSESRDSASQTGGSGSPNVHARVSAPVTCGTRSFLLRTAAPHRLLLKFLVCFHSVSFFAYVCA